MFRAKEILNNVQVLGVKSLQPIATQAVASTEKGILLGNLPDAEGIMITSRMPKAEQEPVSSGYAVVACGPEEEDKPRIKQLPLAYRMIKRTLDLLLAFVLLALVFIPVLIIAIVVKLTSRGPIFYTSERIGLGGRPFQFLKFRTMRVDAEHYLKQLMEKNEKDGPIFKIENDPRITPVGSFLRKYSLDEIPQIIHVVTGHMSIVGPRPPLRREVVQYSRECMERLSVKPGLTCYWQINGRSDLTFDQWMELDQKYVSEMGLMTDLKIIVKTPVAVLSGRGAY